MISGRHRAVSKLDLPLDRPLEAAGGSESDAEVRPHRTIAVFSNVDTALSSLSTPPGDYLDTNPTARAPTARHNSQPKGTNLIISNTLKNIQFPAGKNCEWEPEALPENGRTILEIHVVDRIRTGRSDAGSHRKESEGAPLENMGTIQHRANEP